MLTVRDATAQDAPRCADIYAPYVTDTAISFETQPPDAAVLAARIARAQETHAWLVLDADAGVVGYAYAGAFSARPAYRWSCEVSVYVDTAHQGGGAGRLLYTALFDRLAERGYCTAFAGVSEPNPASTGLHRALGFEVVGTYRRVGWKFGRWLDVTWWQRPLRDATMLAEAPGPLR